jgi:type I restriction enzyme S subunit
VEDGLPMASVKDLTPSGITIDTCRHISVDDFERLARQNCKPQTGDVLIAKDGATALDTVCEIKEPLEVVLLSSVAILRPDTTKVLPSFLKSFLDAAPTRSYMKNAFTTGAAIPRVVLKDFKRAVIDLPPLDEQAKICGILSAYDDLIENNTRRIHILDRMAQSLYQEWFVNFRFPGHAKVKLVDSPTGKIPLGWTPGTLGDIAGEVRRGVNPDDIEPDTPYIGLEHIPRKSIALSEWGTVKEVQSTKLAFKKGEILFGKIRPYFHKVGVAVVDGVCSADAIVIVPKKPEHFALVLACVSSESFVRHATQTSQGTKMPRANWDVLTKYPLPVPVTLLLSIFSESINDAVGLIQNLVFKNRNLRRTRDLLLPKLISGEMDVSKLDIEMA